MFSKFRGLDLRENHIILTFSTQMKHTQIFLNTKDTKVTKEIQKRTVIWNRRFAPHVWYLCTCVPVYLLLSLVKSYPPNLALSNKVVPIEL